MDRKEYYKEYYKKNKEVISNRVKLYLETHDSEEDIQKRKNRIKDYIRNNREILKERSRKNYLKKVGEKYKNIPKKEKKVKIKQVVKEKKVRTKTKKQKEFKTPYKKLNKEVQTLEQYRAKKAKYVKEKRLRDPLFKLKGNIRNLIKNTIKNQGFTKKSKTYGILGCTFDQFKMWIENKFIEGMAWENYGLWEYDHIIPVDSAYSEDDIIRLNHYTNFQPLWKKDNRKKSNKIILL